jgi:hypothetical protein
VARNGKSPNMRLNEAKARFHQVQARLCGDLGVGLRGVTADILVASLLDVCDSEERYPDLLAAVQQERAQRAKGKDSGRQVE